MHNTTDGRNEFVLLDMFLTFLSTEIFNNAIDSAKPVEWGAEVARLPPPSGFIPSLVESDRPPRIESDGLPAAAPPETDTTAQTAQ